MPPTATNPPSDPLLELHPRLGDQPFRDLVAAFYRHARQDDVIGPMYPQDDWEGSEKRLADFLIQRCGGPETYSQERGHPRLRMRHAPFAIGLEARNRWVKHMTTAAAETYFPQDAADLLLPFLGQVATFMINR